jgi:chromosome segregation ATPase
MEDREEDKDALRYTPIVEEEYEEAEDELLELHELENMKRFLEGENEKYKGEVSTLAQELEGINVTIAATQGSIESYEGQIEKYVQNIGPLEVRKESSIADINQVKLKIHAAREDEEYSLILKDTLTDELDQIKSEKAIIIDRLGDIERGIDQISHDRQSKLPHLKEYDVVLRQICNILKGTQNRIEVSLTLKGR